MPSKGRPIVATRLDRDQVDRLGQLAERQGVTVADWLRETIADRLDRERELTGLMT